MSLIDSLKNHSEELGGGVSKKLVSDLELRLDISLPFDFKEYLLDLNYAEIFGDPIYGINPDDEMLDLYAQNNRKEHFRYGFLEVFSNDIDGTIYLRPDSGAVYNASFSVPVATSFSEFVDVLLNGGS